MARLLSKSFFLTLVVIILFVTFATFFDSLPRNSYHGNFSDQGDGLQGAVEQAPVSPPPPISTRLSEEIEEELSGTGGKVAAEKARAEKFRQKEEEKKRIREASKISKLVSFSVPADIEYSPDGSRPDQIILLCASDGKGHNGGIENLVEQTKVNRQAYADLHGYKYHFLNISKYDIAPAHPVWGKLPAIAETFRTYPEAQWVWWLDLDAIIMTPGVDLNELLLSHEALKKQIIPDTELNLDGGRKSGISTPKDPDVGKIDLIFSQDHNGINAGSFFIRRSDWSRTFLDMWADPMFVASDWPGREQDIVAHLVMKHYTVMEHFGLVGMRVLNSYPVGASHMGWSKGDIVVHLAGCWVDGQCVQRWEQYMALREIAPKKEIIAVL